MIGWILVISVWTLCGLAWWIASLLIIARRHRQPRGTPPSDARGISVFKPVAGPLTPTAVEHLRVCLESFVAELDASSELLVGVGEEDSVTATRLVEAIGQRHPAAQVKLIVHDVANEYPNHKIAVMRALSRHAKGELWFWSDADMEAPPGTLRSLREDFAAGGTNFVTSPYIVRDTEDANDVLDQLFVNLEFYPGVELMGRLGTIKFGFGSGVLFEAARFRKAVEWDYLGSCLADDYQLGRLLGRGRLGTTTLVTVPASSGWGAALLHYLRWHKTIRWCRPASYASELVVLPVVGALLSVLCYPVSPWPWVALAIVVLLDSIAASVACWLLGSSLPWRHWPAVALWSVVRGLAWMACWLPWPIVWRGEKWWSPQLEWERRRVTAFDTRPPRVF